MEETIYKTRYILCSLEEYIKLGEVIRNASWVSWGNSGTTRYAPEEPIMTQEVLNEDRMVLIPSLCVLPILADIQEDSPEFYEGFTLVDSDAIIYKQNNENYNE
jgi:hypothetical protein